jgi:hypothetical protein
LTQIVKGHLFTWHIKPRMVNKKNLCFEWPSDCMCSQELNDVCLLCCCFPSILFHVVVNHRPVKWYAVFSHSIEWSLFI